MVRPRIKLNKLATLGIVFVLFLLVFTILAVVINSGRSEVKQAYNREEVQTINEQLSSIGRAIDKIYLSESSWVDESICRRYPPMSIAEKERFTCFVVFKSEVLINSQNDVDKLIDDHKRALTNDALLSNVKLDKKPTYTDDRLTLQSSSYDKSAQLGSVSFRIDSSPYVTCGLSYELSWNNGVYIEQVLHCNVDSTGDFF